MTELEIKLLNLCKGKSWEFTTDFGALIPEIIETIKAQLVPDGFVLVPMVPSQRMVDAVRKYYECEPYLPFSLYSGFINQAMIEAQEQSHE